MTRWFRYVPPARVAAYLSLGWKDLGPAPGHHGVWSNVMVAFSDECPKEPEL